MCTLLSFVLLPEQAHLNITHQARILHFPHYFLSLLTFFYDLEFLRIPVPSIYLCKELRLAKLLACCLHPLRVKTRT
jgi:hypothetical protein